MGACIALAPLLAMCQGLEGIEREVGSAPKGRIGSSDGSRWQGAVSQVASHHVGGKAGRALQGAPGNPPDRAQRGLPAKYVLRVEHLGPCSENGHVHQSVSQTLCGGVVRARRVPASQPRSNPASSGHAHPLRTISLKQSCTSSGGRVPCWAAQEGIRFEIAVGAEWVCKHPITSEATPHAIKPL